MIDGILSQSRQQQAPLSKNQFPFLFALKYVLRFWNMSYLFNYQYAFCTFLRVFLLSWVVWYFLVTCWIMYMLGFGGFFVLLDFHTLIHPAMWSIPLLVAGWAAFRRGLIVEHGEKNKQN